jgi:hypothetical protein
VGWQPGPGQTGAAAEVPTGFVTDFASIPRLFWSALRPDGEYSYAAIIHDYLYWSQERTRKESDDVMYAVMEDLGIDKLTIDSIYGAVRLAGDSAWDANAAMKRQGEKRVLRIFPDRPTIRWADWKQRADVFA